MTALIAVIGVAFLIYGLLIFIAFGIASAALARVQKTALYGHVRNSDLMRDGEALIGNSIDMIPSAFVQRLIRNRLGAHGEDLAFSVAMNLLRGRSRSGIWFSALGIVLFFASFFLGPRLSQMIGA